MNTKCSKCGGTMRAQYSMFDNKEVLGFACDTCDNIVYVRGKEPKPATFQGLFDSVAGQQYKSPDEALKHLVKKIVTDIFISSDRDFTNHAMMQMFEDITGIILFQAKRVAELADVQILLFDATRRAGISCQELLDAATQKIQVTKVPAPNHPEGGPV